MNTLDWNKPLNNNVGEDDMAEASEIQTASTNPHTQLDEIADAIDRGVPPDLIVHEAELEESRRRRQFVARFTLSLTQIGIFIMIITILFFFQITDAFRDLLNILVGGFLATFTKISDYWFKADTGDEGKK
tara:strand:+ start:11178 stop:11570 length:393 start_codon:yes stop_codon:yes gene_type:complete